MRRCRVIDLLLGYVDFVGEVLLKHKSISKPTCEYNIKSKRVQEGNHGKRHKFFWFATKSDYMIQDETCRPLSVLLADPCRDNMGTTI